MTSRRKHEGGVEEITAKTKALKTTNTCEYCGGKFLKGERDFNCCSDGEIKIDYLIAEKTFEIIDGIGKCKDVLKLNGKLALGRTKKQGNGTDANWLANSHPIIFRNGATGWYEGLKSVGNEERSITLQEYMAYISMERKNIFNPIHHGKMFSMHLYLSSWAIFEQSQLEKYKSDQERIRANTKKELIGTGDFPKTRIILPSSHEGSYRYMAEQYLDSLAIVAKFGKPDYFITFVCNRHWSEIADRSGSADNRPDLIARFFKIEVDRMLDEYILKDKLFGEVEAYVLVYEWQERGLPHIHMLLTMKEKHKPNTAKDVDRVIETNHFKYNENDEIRAANMEHWFCSTLANATCLKKGKCKEGFPKLGRERTELINGKWEYKRGPEDGYVVPYNPKLHEVFKAHINVEACDKNQTNIELLEYLHKGSKDDGNDQWRRDSDNEDFNEIDHHLNYRSLLAPEACHRLFGFPVFQRSHEVYRLPIQKDSAQITKFFEMNSKFKKREKNGKDMTGKVDPRKYTYEEFPSMFEWKNGEWKERTNKEAKVIGRIYSVLPTETEEFALRCLLLNSKGPTCFEDLRTVSDDGGNSDTYESFQEAAEIKQLFTREACKEALEDCKMYMGPKKMRKTVASIRETFEDGGRDYIYKDLDYLSFVFHSDMIGDIETKDYDEQIEEVRKRMEAGK